MVRDRTISSLFGLAFSLYGVISTSLGIVLALGVSPIQPVFQVSSI